MMDVHILGNFKFYCKHEVDAHIERYKAEIDELKKDPYKGEYKRKYIQAKAEIAELKAENQVLKKEK